MESKGHRAFTVFLLVVLCGTAIFFKFGTHKLTETSALARKQQEQLRQEISLCMAKGEAVTVRGLTGRIVELDTVRNEAVLEVLRVPGGRLRTALADIVLPAPQWEKGAATTK